MRNPVNNLYQVNLYQLGDTVCAPFFEKGQPLECLSNFSDLPITVNGLTYPTSEHYFQAQKFPNGSPQQQAIRKASSSGEALQLARQFTQAQGWGSPKKQPLSSQWQSWFNRSQSVMETALRAKLQQYPHIKTALINTRSSCLIEDTFDTNERIWGWGEDGGGRNTLGRLWMMLRNEIHNKNKQYDLIVDPVTLFQKAAANRPKARSTIAKPLRNYAKCIFSNAVTSSHGNKKASLFKSQHKSEETARQYVLHAITKNKKYQSAYRVRVCDNIKPGHSKVVKVDFKNSAEAALFQQEMKATKVFGTVVLIGPGCAPFIFKNLGIPEYGRHNSLPTMQALLEQSQPAANHSSGHKTSANSAAQYVLDAIASKGYQGALRLRVTENLDGTERVVKLDFGSTKQALQFHKNTEATRASGTVVIICERDANNVFSHLDIPVYGQTNKYPMFNALLHEATQNQGNRTLNNNNISGPDVG